MEHGVGYLELGEKYRLDPRQPIPLEWQQEWIKTLALGSILFLLLSLLAVFIYMGAVKNAPQDGPGTRHIEENGRAYVLLDDYPVYDVSDIETS